MIGSLPIANTRQEREGSNCPTMENRSRISRMSAKPPKTLFNKQFRERVHELEGHWKSSLIIRIIILLLVIVAICLISLQQLRVDLLWFANIGLGYVGAWTLVVILCRLFMVKPIHPGVHVAFELVAWAEFLPLQVFTYMNVFVFSREYEYPEIWYSRPVGIAMLVSNFAVCGILTILTVLHFYLFVRACIDTSRRRSYEIATRAATIAAQMMKNMESRGTFYRRDSDVSYGYSPFEEAASGYIIGLENLNSHASTGDRRRDLENMGLVPVGSSGLSIRSRARSGRTVTSQARTQYSHARSLSVPVPTSPRSLRTVFTDDPSLFRLDYR